MRERENRFEFFTFNPEKQRFLSPYVIKTKKAIKSKFRVKSLVNKFNL